MRYQRRLGKTDGLLLTKIQFLGHFLHLFRVNVPFDMTKEFQYCSYKIAAVIRNCYE